MLMSLFFISFTVLSLILIYNGSQMIMPKVNETINFLHDTNQKDCLTVITHGDFRQSSLHRQTYFTGGLKA